MSGSWPMFVIRTFAFDALRGSRRSAVLLHPSETRGVIRRRSKTAPLLFGVVNAPGQRVAEARTTFSA